MKNYLYILCAFLLAFAGCTKDADVEPIAPAPDGNTQVVLTGFSGRGTRTGFGGAEDGAVPFLWSAGDYIWARNTRSEAIAEGGSQATFVFESLETADTYDVFYNLTGPAAATALIPAEQTQQAAGELNLGQNGDFGYATAQNGTFTLEHATSYVWFDTYSSDVTSNLLSITLSVSGGQTIAGEAAFADGKLGDCKGSSSVTLSFGEEGIALPSQSSDTDVFAAMVLYPADLSAATVSIVYKFADGSVYLQTKSGKTLTPGHTLRLSTQIAKADCKSSGASLGVAIFLLGAPLLGLTGHPLISTLGIAGAAWIGSALILMLIAAVSRRIKDIMVILILGMMFSSGVGAVVQILQYLSNEAALKSFVVWTMGSLGDVTLGQLGLLLPAVVLGLVLAVAVIKPLNLLLLGENYARTMGLDIRRSRQLIFLSTTLLAGTVTAFCGPIGFIGLAVPHVARILFADADHRILVPASILTGIVVMLLCDVLAKLLTFPINTITALLGIPIVIWVVIRNKSIV